MYIGRSSAHVYNHYVAYTVVQELGTLHYCAGSWYYRTVYHISHMFHARRVGDVVLKGFLNNFAAWLHVERIDFRIYVIYYI